MQELKATSRTLLGKRVKNLRKEGFLPAVIYGEKITSQAIAVPYKNFEKILKDAGESTLVTLTIDGKSYNVLIHDIAHDPIRGTPIHADFYAVRMDKAIRTKVPVDFFGDSSAVKNESGVLIKVLQELEVEGLPQDLPRDVKADLALLGAFGSRILVKDIPLPKGVKAIAHADEVIVLVEAPRSEEELVALKETLPEAAPVEVKTEQEIKRAEKAQIKEGEEKAEIAGKEEAN